MSTHNDRMPENVAEALSRSAERMTDDARAGVRQTVMGAIRHDSRAHYLASISHRVAATLAALGLLGSGVAYAADNALPGDTLYELKRAAENALVAVLPPGALEDSVLVGVAGRRAEEAASLASKGAAQHLVNDAIGELRIAVQEAEAANGPLTNEDATRIQERGEDAPEPTREAISSAVNAPDGAGTSGGSGSSPATPGDGGTTPGGGYQGNPDAPGGSPDTTGGAGPR
ncbi:MAG: DUF5667 domain-containing protein [Coriobacteriia bacterium]|nr:DUF5667 domain-containing protein [Coriobacteriia bacterium]